MKILHLIIDGSRFSCSISPLAKCFGFFEKIPNDQEVVRLMVSISEWELINSFVTFGTVPTSSQEWIRILMTAEYLQLRSPYVERLKERAKKYLRSKGSQNVEVIDNISQICSEIDARSKKRDSLPTGSHLLESTILCLEPLIKSKL